MDNTKTTEKKEKFRKVDVSQKSESAHPDEFKTTEVYKDLLLPLTEEAFSGFVSQVREDGRIITPIIVDGEMVILDGHHRLEAAKKIGLTTIPYEMVTGLSQEEKIELIYVKNLNRRQLTLDQMKEVCEERFKNYRKLFDQNPKDWTIERIASLTGKSVEVVRRKLRKDGVFVPDRRMTLNKEDHVEIKKLVDAKKPYAEIAALFGVSKGRISQLVKPQPKSKPKAAPAKKATPAETVSGPFVQTWPVEKKKQATLIGEIKSACSVGSMAVAVIPKYLIDEVKNLIQPEQVDVDEYGIAETDIDQRYGEVDDWDSEIDEEAIEATDEDLESIENLFGGNDDDEEDE